MYKINDKQSNMSQYGCDASGSSGEFAVYMVVKLSPKPQSSIGMYKDEDEQCPHHQSCEQENSSQDYRYCRRNSFTCVSGTY